MVGLNDSRREDPENFRLILGATNLQDLTSVQILGIDLIVKVNNETYIFEWARADCRATSSSLNGFLLFVLLHQQPS